MPGPATPGQEGPSFAPPPLPQGWIAQWDGVGRKYYFVQLSTGASQWELPTHPAPTVGTPTTTPGQETSPFAPPGQHQEIDQREFEREKVGPDGRGLTSMAMSQLLHTTNNGRFSDQKSSPLVNLAGSVLSGASLSQGGHSSDSGASGIAGALSGSLMGGGKQNSSQHQQLQHHSNYSGPQPQGGYNQQQGQGGLTGKTGDMFDRSAIGQPSNQYGYSRGGTQQGGYTSQALPTSYQPAAPPPYEQSQRLLHGAGSSSGAGPYYNPQQPAYGSGAPQQQRQSAYSSSAQSSYGTPHQYSQQTGYGTPHQQPTYGVPLQHQQHQYPLASNYNAAPPHQQQPPYNSGAYSGIPIGNQVQPQHRNFQETYNTSHQGGVYGTGERPTQLPVSSHPNQSSIPGQYSGSGPGSYSEIQRIGRWQTNEGGRQWN